MDLVEKVARALQQVNEQNGAAPYDGLDIILGAKGGKIAREQLFEQATAAIQVVTEHMRNCGRQGT